MAKKNKTDEELLSELKVYISKYGVPTTRDIKVGTDEISSVYVYTSRFGSLLKAMELCDVNLDDKKKQSYNREEIDKDKLAEILIYNINKILETENRLITSTDIRYGNKKHTSLNQKWINWTAITKHFGGLSKFYKDYLGIDYKQFNKDILEKDMIEKYISLSDNLGRPAHSRDLDRYSKEGLCYANKTYEAHFGKISEFQKSLGYNETFATKSKTKEDTLDDLILLANKLNRLPTQLDVNSIKWCPSACWYAKNFGSFTLAIKEAGLNEMFHKRGHTTKLGNYCRSSYEFDFCNMLEDNDFVFKQEVYYRDLIENFDRKFRFDFVLYIDNKTYPIEIFGYANFEDYLDKTKEKINICDKNGLNLISLYRKDFDTNNLYTMIMNKINNFNQIVLTQD